MTHFADSFMVWLGDYYLLSSLLLALALGATSVLRQPAHRLAIAKATLVALAILAALCALPRWSVVHLITADRNQPQSIEARLVQPATIEPIRFAPATSLNDPVFPREAAIEESPVTTESGRHAPVITWPLTLTVIYVAGALGFAIWLCIGSLAARRLRHSATAAPPQLVAFLSDVVTRSRVSPKLDGSFGETAVRPTLLVSNRIEVPVALGIVRPAILLPRTFAQSAIRNPGHPLGAEIECVLAHELAHIHNRDLHWLAASRLLTTVLWAQPLFWLLRRRMRLEQESLADAAAAELTSRQLYAEQLVAWARNIGRRRSVRVASAVGLWEGPSQLHQRIALLLNDRFIVLRHFSRKLQLAAVAFCTLSGVGLSLVTLEPAQSMPQEKPAPPPATSLLGRAVTEPDHIKIDDRFILCPVTTELQRSLLGNVDTPKSDASLCVFANYSAYEGDTIDADSTYFAGLSERFTELAKQDNRYAIINVQVGQISAPFNILTERAQEISKLLAKLARDAGYKKSIWSVTYKGSDLSWSETAAKAETEVRRSESKVEDSVGNDRVRVFPVHTFLLRMLMQDSDCVVNLGPVWQKTDGSQFLEPFVPSIKRFLPELRFNRKEVITIRVRFAKDAQALVDEGSGNTEQRKKLGESLGFANCLTQQTAVSDEDAKRDKDARAEATKPSSAVKTDDPPIDERGTEKAKNEPKDATALSFTKPVPNSVAGRAIDEKGEPVAGAEVFLFHIQRNGPSRESLGQTKTNASGQFRFENVIDIAKEYPNKKFPPLNEPGSDFVEIVLRANSRASSGRILIPQVVAKVGESHEFMLPAAVTLKGRVTGPDGSPVVGAAVSIDNGGLGHWDGASSSRTDARGYYTITDAMPFDMEELEKQIDAAEAKRAPGEPPHIDDLKSAAPKVSVVHSDFATQLAPVRKSPGTTDVQLAAAATLDGRVVFADGKPASGAIIGLATSYTINLGDPPPTIAPQIYTTSVAADASGKYRISSLPAGKYDLWADVPGWVNAGAVAIEAKPGAPTTVPDLVAIKGGSIRARLVDADTNVPIGLSDGVKAELTVEQFSRSAGRPVTNHQVAPNSDGLFEIRALPGRRLLLIGGVEVNGAAKWYSEKPVVISVSDGETKDINVPVADIANRVAALNQKARAQRPGATPLPNAPLLPTPPPPPPTDFPAAGDANQGAVSPAKHAYAVDSVDDHKMAERIGDQLKQSGELRGFRISVKFHDGVAFLGGNVASPEQREAAEKIAEQCEGVTRVSSSLVCEPKAETDKPPRTPTVLSYGDGKADGRKSYGGSGHMIQFEMPEGVTKIKGIRIHGSRYGLPQAPNEDFEITFLSDKRDEVLHTESAPYKLFKRGKENWVRIAFDKEVELPRKFWIALDFNAEQTKGVYVSYDTSTKGKYSRVGKAGDEKEPKETDFGGDWMVQVNLAPPPK